MRASCFLVFSLLFSPALAGAGESLLFLEAQAVAGHSSAAGSPVYHSMSAAAPMQKTSAGFDYIGRFSGASGDRAALAVQARLAWDRDAPNRLEPQLYSAYFRLKTPFAYVWAGHNRTASGLESYFDTHGALLQTLPMYGYGFERDWGLGAGRDFDGGDAAVSFTTGSGMRLTAAGGWLASGRLSRGVLARDNFTLGLYVSAGETPGVSGYRLTDPAEKSYSSFGADYALLWDSWELRADLRGGKKRGADYLAGLARAGLNLFDEDRLKLEAQAVYSGHEGMEGWIFGTGFSLRLSPSLTWRAMFEYEDMMNDRRAVTQLYYYFPI